VWRALGFLIQRPAGMVEHLSFLGRYQCDPAISVSMTNAAKNRTMGHHD
jgi:hypothetical protein